MFCWWFVFVQLQCTYVHSHSENIYYFLKQQIDFIFSFHTYRQKCKGLDMTPSPESISLICITNKIGYLSPLIKSLRPPRTPAARSYKSFSTSRISFFVEKSLAYGKFYVRLLLWNLLKTFRHFYLIEAKFGSQRGQQGAKKSFPVFPKPDSLMYVWVSHKAWKTSSCWCGLLYSEISTCSASFDFRPIMALKMTGRLLCPDKVQLWQQMSTWL